MKLDSVIEWVKAEIAAGDRCLLVLHGHHHQGRSLLKDALGSIAYVASLPTATMDDFALAQAAMASGSACVIEHLDRHVALHDLHPMVARLPSAMRKHFLPSLGPTDANVAQDLAVLDARDGATTVYAREGMNDQSLVALGAEANAPTYTWDTAPSRRIAAKVPNGPHLLTLLRRGWSTMPYATKRYEELNTLTMITCSTKSDAGWNIEVLRPSGLTKPLEEARASSRSIAYWSVSPYRSGEHEHHGVLATLARESN